MSSTKPEVVRFKMKTARKRNDLLGKQLGSRGTRELIESLAIAIILAFIFRAFEAEAFIIPTGSMAPTLQGRHKDVECEKCGHWYQVGASSEREQQSNMPSGTHVYTGTCPVCRWKMTLDLEGNANHSSFSGDRILVSKFDYWLDKPERWDVIVFKYPNNVRLNYIKRLVGLPNETLRIWRGDVYVKKQDEDEFQIERKPADKVKALLQLVDDSQHIPQEVKDHMPARWQAWSPAGENVSDALTTSDGGNSYHLDGEKSEAWARYHHIIPTPEEWEYLSRNQAPPQVSNRQGRLIADFYTYNVFDQLPPQHYNGHNFPFGLHWVGDLALECEVEPESEQGELILDLVEGGTHYQCRIDLATGQATLSIDGGETPFVDDEGNRVQHPTAQTSVRGGDVSELRFANVDDQLVLWVDDDPVSFDGPTTYLTVDDLQPEYGSQDPGDAAPAAVGFNGASGTLHRLRILRDIYYLAIVDPQGPRRHELKGLTHADYDLDFNGDGAITPDEDVNYEDVVEILSTPRLWGQTELFENRRQVDFVLGENEYFPLGDNSPQSLDARLWGGDSHVDGELLTGKALYIYWPHYWWRPIPFQPNFKRMTFIR